MDGPPTVTKDSLQLLHNLLGLIATGSISASLSESVLVAVDFEYLNNIQQYREDDGTPDIDSQAGLAILDTKNLGSPRIDHVISTYNFATGSSKYCTKASKRFLFGKSDTIRSSELLKSIESLMPRSRKIVLVGHDVSHDLRVLKHLKFDFQTSVIGIIDTLWLANQVLSTHSRTLKDLLGEFQCPFDKLHSAGNDAHFTLRLLLLLAGYTKRNDAEYEDKLALLKSIAYSPIPQRTDPHTKAAVKKRKREQRSRKHQSKFWDSETQGRIRAERARKKEAVEQP